MSHPVKGVDHVFLLVNDLDQAQRQYEALGFTVSPRGLHSVSKGSANHTIMFPDDYMELLGLLTATPANRARGETLARSGEGLHAIACRIDTAEGAASALADLGLSTHGLGSFERPVPLPSGGEGVAAFSTVAFSPELVPLGMVFMCQHKTRETVWIPELIEHENTACGLGGVRAISADPDADGARFAKLFADAEVSKIDGGVHLKTGRNSAPLTLLTRDAMARSYPTIDLDQTQKEGFTVLQIKVKSLDKAAACLKHMNNSTIETARGIAVRPDHAAGAILEFVPAV